MIMFPVAELKAQFSKVLGGGPRRRADWHPERKIQGTRRDDRAV